MNLDELLERLERTEPALRAQIGNSTSSTRVAARVIRVLRDPACCNCERRFADHDPRCPPYEGPQYFHYDHAATMRRAEAAIEEEPK